MSETEIEAMVRDALAQLQLAHGDYTRVLINNAIEVLEELLKKLKAV